MASKDLIRHLNAAISLSPAARTANATGTSVDLHGYESAAIYIVTGAITDGTHAIDIEESDDNSTWADVAAGDLDGTEPSIGATDDDKVFEIGYLGKKRYLRVNVTVTGATSGGVYGAVVVRGHARREPA